MPRKYSHIQEHEKEIIELRSQGMTLRQIGEKLGFTYKEMRGFSFPIQSKAAKTCSGSSPKTQGTTQERRSPGAKHCRIQI